MDNLKESRKITRNKMWPDTSAHLRYRTRYGAGSTSIEEVSAKIENLNAKGMYVLTENLIITDTELEIELQFNDKISLNAEGKVLRRDENGVAVRFTKIDTKKLTDCIMERMNSD